MGHRLTKIYTRTGDDGTSGLADGSRVKKDDDIIVVLGSIDELNAAIGVVLANSGLSNEIRSTLSPIQHQLFNLGAEIATQKTSIFSEQQVQTLEKQIDSFNKQLKPLKEFILPGGHPAAATCHIARTICRRAEREFVTFSKKYPSNSQSLMYLNRLSDLLFVIARIVNRQQGIDEVLWEHD